MSFAFLSSRKRDPAISRPTRSSSMDFDIVFRAFRTDDRARNSRRRTKTRNNTTWQTMNPFRYYVPRSDERNIQCRSSATVAQAARRGAAARYFKTATNYRSLDTLEFYICREYISDVMAVYYATTPGLASNVGGHVKIT